MNKMYFITGSHDGNGEPCGMAMTPDQYAIWKGDTDEAGYKLKCESFSKYTLRSTWIEVDEATYTAFKAFVKTNSEEFGYLVMPHNRDTHVKALAEQEAA